MSQSQKDLYQNAGRAEPSKAPVNLYGGKFYRRGSSQSLWERTTKGKDMKEKKSGWNNLKKAIFTPMGTNGYSERRQSKEKCLLQNKKQDFPDEIDSTFITSQGIHPKVVDPVPTYRD